MSFYVGFLCGAGALARVFLTLLDADGDITAMPHPKEAGWRYRIRPFGNCVYAMMFAAIGVLVVSAFYPELRSRYLLLTFVGFFVAFYFVWNWVFYERSAELTKRLPISHKELRKRKKEFFDNLPR